MFSMGLGFMFIGFFFILLILNFSWLNFLVLLLSLEGVMMFLYCFLVDFISMSDLAGEILLIFLLLMVLSGAYGLSILIYLSSSFSSSMKLGLFL